MHYLTIAALLALTAPACAAGVLELHADGAQIYACSQVGGAFSWALKGPEATLTSADGKTIVHHFAGPTWQAPDGSTVVGEVRAAGVSPSVGAIPWLVLHAKSHSGKGLLESVEYVIRSETQGGAPPATGCDAAHPGAEARVHYTATYTFFGTN